ncbi:MAG: hypothetical protein HDR96_01945 [Bacteroides sp.]|nr:hypothetical protein [Bacteroides sp.]
MEEKYIVALEIGSSKIKGAIGIVDPSGSLSVKAVEEEKLTDSVRYGCILNIRETTDAIRNVINRLEQREPQRKITSVYVSVGGRSLMSQDIEVERHLPSEMEITNEIIADMTKEALEYKFQERTIIGVSPKEFRVDNFPANRVVGMFGSYITARLNLISCRSRLMTNLKVVLDERMHLAINDFFVRPLIEADLVLFPEEKRKGCMLVDCGADTTTVAIFKNGVLTYLSTIPMGSRHITLDITALNYLEERAEDLKIEGGNAVSQSDPASAYRGVGVDFNQINNYVSARAGEIIANINEQIKYAGLDSGKLGSIILVGRGSKLRGFDTRLEKVTNLPVRFGAPVSRIRILDGRLNGADNVDVISVLSAAASDRSVRECMERKMPEHNYSAHVQGGSSQYAAQNSGYAAQQSPYQQQPAAQQSPYQQQPAAQQSPYQQQPAAQQSPYQQQPAAQQNPYQQQPAAQQNPYQQQPAAQQNPYQQQPAAQQSPYQQQPAAQQNPYQQQPAAQQNPYQQQQPEQPQQHAAYQPGGYPYQAGQQPYQAPQPNNNPYGQQARNITPINETQPEQPVASQTPSAKRGGLGNFWNKLRDRAVSIMTEPVEDDDPDNDN